MFVNRTNVYYNLVSYHNIFIAGAFVNKMQFHLSLLLVMGILVSYTNAMPRMEIYKELRSLLKVLSLEARESTEYTLFTDVNHPKALCNFFNIKIYVQRCWILKGHWIEFLISCLICARIHNFMRFTGGSWDGPYFYIQYIFFFIF